MKAFADNTRAVIYTSLFAMLMLPLLVQAQSKEVQFDHLSMKDGLSMNPIMTIAQDNAGFLWFGTPDGLNRYDGYNFKVYKSDENDPNSLSDNFITALSVSREGNIWVGTLGNGLNEYSSLTGSFKRFLSTDGSSKIKSNNIWSLNQDRRGRLWVGTDKGLTVIDTKTEELIPYLEEHPALVALNELTILKMFEDKDGVCWFGSTAGLYKYNPANQKVTKYLQSDPGANSLSQNIVIDIYQDSRQTIWVGTVDGLNKYNERGDDFTKFYFKKKVTKEEAMTFEQNTYSLINIYSGNTVRTMIEDEYGTLWMGTDMELIRFNIFTEEFVSFEKDLNDATGINDHFIRALFMDESDNLWIGTMGSGLNKVDLKPRKFVRYEKKLNDPTSLSQNYIRAIAEDLEGNIWLGTLVGGLNKFFPNEEVFQHYSHDPDKPGLTPNGNNVWSLLVDRDNILWVGTNTGLNRFDLQTGKFKYYTHSAEDRGSLSENTVRSIFEDASGVLWIGTEYGLNKFDKETEKFTRYVKNGDGNTSISDNTIWSITQDRNGNIWIATDNGLNRLNPNLEKFKHYRKVKGNEGSISHNGIRTLYIDSRGVLWVGTQRGLCRFNRSKDSFDRYDESSGMPNSFVYGILEDAKGNLWMSILINLLQKLQLLDGQIESLLG